MKELPTYAEIREAFKKDASWLLSNPNIVGHYIAEGPVGVVMLKESFSEQQKEEVRSRLGVPVIFEVTGPIEAQGQQTPAGLTHGPAGDVALPSLEGLKWDTPGMQPPGRPKPGE